MIINLYVVPDVALLARQHDGKPSTPPKPPSPLEVKPSNRIALRKPPLIAYNPDSPVPKSAISTTSPAIVSPGTVEKQKKRDRRQGMIINQASDVPASSSHTVAPDINRVFDNTKLDGKGPWKRE